MTKLEEKIEEESEAYIEESWPGSLFLKVTLLKKAGFPDRLIIAKFPEKSIMFFVEFKQKNKKPRKLQVHWINKLRDAGASVYVCDSTESFIAACKKERYGYY